MVWKEEYETGTNVDDRYYADADSKDLLKAGFLEAGNQLGGSSAFIEVGLLCVYNPPQPDRSKDLSYKGNRLSGADYQKAKQEPNQLKSVVLAVVLDGVKIVRFVYAHFLGKLNNIDHYDSR